MDDRRFDVLTRTFSRRTGVGLLAALGLGIGIVPHDGEAKKNKKKKTCKPACSSCKTCVKGKCKPKPNGSRCAGGVCQSSKCVPLDEICSDGVRNGNETGVDCGGSCPRCGNGNACTKRSDCSSAFCKDDVQCQVCQSDQNCPDDADGACICGDSIGVGSTCVKAEPQTLVTECDECPDDLVCVFISANSRACHKRCGSS